MPNKITKNGQSSPQEKTQPNFRVFLRIRLSQEPSHVIAGVGGPLGLQQPLRQLAAQPTLGQSSNPTTELFGDLVIQTPETFWVGENHDLETKCWKKVEA